MSVDGLRCILYARIYIPYMHTILYHYIHTGRPPVPIGSELKLKTNSCLVQYLSDLLFRISLYHIIRQTVPNINDPVAKGIFPCIISTHILSQFKFVASSTTNQPVDHAALCYMRGTWRGLYEYQRWNWVAFCDPATQWPGNPATRRPSWVSWPGDPVLQWTPNVDLCAKKYSQAKEF